MNINAEWHKELLLKLDKQHNSMYTVDLDDIPNEPGIYVFIRQHGNAIIPLYVGQATSLKIRIKQQLNNLKLMVNISDSGTGSKKLLFCTLQNNKGTKRNKCLDILEKLLIDHCLTEGYEIFNISGTREKYHNIEFKSIKTADILFKRKMVSKITR